MTIGSGVKPIDRRKIRPFESVLTFKLIVRGQSATYDDWFGYQIDRSLENSTVWRFKVTVRGQSATDDERFGALTDRSLNNSTV